MLGGIPHALEELRVLAELLSEGLVVNFCNGVEFGHEVLHDGCKALLDVVFDALEQLYFGDNLVAVEGRQHQELLF